MALVFLSFVPMISPRAHEIAIVSEEERRTREQGEEDEPGEERSPNFTPSHPHAVIHIHDQTKRT
jgi:hypothetical protein